MRRRKRMTEMIVIIVIVRGGIIGYRIKRKRIRITIRLTARVMILEGERWGLVVMVDRVRVIYMIIIIKEGLRGERRVAMWYRLVYRLARARIIMWNRRDIGRRQSIVTGERMLVG